MFAWGCMDAGADVFEYSKPFSFEHISVGKYIQGEQ